jgi:hypothetical protein
MRGLPPPPPDVMQLTAQFDVDAGAVTNSWWVFAPGADGATTLQLSAIAAAWFFSCLPDLLSVLPISCSCSVLRLRTFGVAPLDVAEQPAPNAGALGATQVLNSAAVMTWRTSTKRLGGNAHTWLPLTDDLVGDDHRQLHPISWSQLQSAARLYVNHVNALTSPDGALCVLAVVRRSSQGAPLAHSLLDPVVLGDASRFVGTLQRRIRARVRSSS